MMALLKAPSRDHGSDERVVHRCFSNSETTLRGVELRVSRDLLDDAQRNASALELREHVLELPEGVDRGKDDLDAVLVLEAE
jgi:hypothetical protein